MKLLQLLDNILNDYNYKITYTNGETETFNSYRNNASEESIKDAYIRAYSNTLLFIVPPP